MATLMAANASTMIGPLPVGAWAVIGAAGVAMYFAGRDMNRKAQPSTVIVQDYPRAYPLLFSRFGFRRRRHPPTPEPPGGTPIETPGTPPPGTEPTGVLPGVSSAVSGGVAMPTGLVTTSNPHPIVSPFTAISDPAVPPYSDASVLSTLVAPPYPHLTYVTPGESDDIYTIASRIYNNPRRAIDIFNANRIGVFRVDGTPGIMPTPNTIEPGVRLIIP